MPLAQSLRELHGLDVTGLRRLDLLVNDLVVVETASDRFALKLYNVRSRGVREVSWEVDLVEQLARADAPVARPVRGAHGFVETLELDGHPHAAVLWRWAPGAKPSPSRETYLALGEAAARIHAAADAAELPRVREDYTAEVLIDEQIARMRTHLTVVRRYDEVAALGRRLRAHLDGARLDRGICHMDLTLDNIHRTADGIIAFDFDSAGLCWRAMEPYGVLRFSDAYFQDWLEGYRRIRPFSPEDERAVSAFAIIGDLRNTAWQLGVAVSSRGAPLLATADLAGVVDGWLAWERGRLQ